MVDREAMVSYVFIGKISRKCYNIFSRVGREFHPRCKVRSLPLLSGIGGYAEVDSVKLQIQNTLRIPMDSTNDNKIYFSFFNLILFHGVTGSR